MKTLAREHSLLGIVAVGNTRNLYVALDENIEDKIIKYVEEKCKMYIVNNRLFNINSNQVRAIKDTIIAKEVLTNPSKFSMVFDKYNRRSV